MNYKLDMLIKDIVENKGMYEELNEKSEEMSKKYSVDLEQLEYIKTGNLSKLYQSGAHPLFLLKFSKMIGVNLVNRYEEMQ